MASKILITSVGSLVGQNILDALEGRRNGLLVLGTNSIAQAPGNFRCDKAYRVPAAMEHQVYADKLLEILDQEQPDLVIPARDDDVLALAALLRAHPRLSSRVLAGSVEVAETMNDKVASFEFSRKFGLPFVDTVASDAPDAAAQIDRMRRHFGFPLIAKPRSGNGSRGIRVLLHEHHLMRAMALPGFAIQPMIDPPRDLALDLSDGVPFFWGVSESRLHGVQSLIDRHGSVTTGMGFVAEMVMGRCERLTRCDDPALHDVAKRFATQTARSGWRGPLNMQFKRDRDLGYLAIELNGRFTGGTSARMRLGFDEVGECVNAWLGGGVVPLATPNPGTNTVVIKTLCDFPLPAVAHEAMNRDGVWTRSS